MRSRQEMVGKNRSMQQAIERYCFSPLLCAALLLQCNYRESDSLASYTFSPPPGNEKVYQFTDRYFMLIPGDTAMFYGTRCCTLLVNGSLASAVQDSSFFRTITAQPTGLLVNGKNQPVYPQCYQQAAFRDQLDSNSILRYFMKTDTAILHCAYEDHGVLTHVPDGRQKVVPALFDVGSFATSPTSSNSWLTTLLVPDPFPIAAGHSWITGQSVCTRAVAQQSMPVYTCNGVDYRNGIQIMSYYALDGQSTEEGNRFDFIGTFVIDRKYFKNAGLVDETMNLAVEKKLPDNTVEIIKETTIHQRGPEGARIYPDTAALSLP